MFKILFQNFSLKFKFHEVEVRDSIPGNIDLWEEEVKTSLTLFEQEEPYLKSKDIKKSVLSPCLHLLRLVKASVLMDSI